MAKKITYGVVDRLPKRDIVGVLNTEDLIVEMGDEGTDSIIELMQPFEGKTVKISIEELQEAPVKEE